VTARIVRDRLPDRPAISRPAGQRETPPATTGGWWARQPGLGVAGLSLVLPVAVLLTVGAGGAEPSLLVFGPLVTFALPVVAMIAFWWDDWPGTRLRRNWSGWADTVLIAVAAIGLTLLGQAVIGRVDLSVLFDPTPAGGHLGTFPATMPVAGAAFVVMLQLTLVSEGWPLRRHAGVITGGLGALALSWLLSIALYGVLLGGRPFRGPGHGLLTSGQLGALLTLFGAWQVWLFVVWRGWPFAEISRRSLRLLSANAAVFLAAGLTYAVLYDWIGLDTATVGALAGPFVAGGLLVGMLFEGSLAARLSAARERVVALGLVVLCAVALHVLLIRFADSLQWTHGSAEEWVSHVGLNAIGVSIILHVAIGRRWPFGPSPGDTAQSLDGQPA
jgi:hypothetical protein